MIEVYKLTARVFSGHNVVGYMIEGKDGLGDAYWDKEFVKDNASHGQILNVMSTNTGLVGVNGFELKSLPSISIDEATRLQGQRNINIARSNQITQQRSQQSGIRKFFGLFKK